MKRWILMTLLVGLATVTRAATPVETLVEAERAFAKKSVTTSMRGAFLEFLAPNAIVFRPGPVNGVEVYKARPESKVVLAWEPTVAEISAAGDMGFTSGPWSFKSAPDAEPNAFGHYVSVWKKQADGTWKVAIDVGVGHDKPASASPADFRSARADSKQKVVIAQAAAMLANEDKVLATEIAAKGASTALKAHVAKDVRVYRMNKFPGVGPAAVPGDLAKPVVTPTGRDMAVSADFGYTYGSVTPEGAREPASYYFRIWRREADGVWRVIVDLDSPVPPKG